MLQEGVRRESPEWQQVFLIPSTKRKENSEFKCQCSSWVSQDGCSDVHSSNHLDTFHPCVLPSSTAINILNTESLKHRCALSWVYTGTGNLSICGFIPPIINLNTKISNRWELFRNLNSSKSLASWTSDHVAVSVTFDNHFPTWQNIASISLLPVLGAET